jgi:PAS domain S-box-containing protein
MFGTVDMKHKRRQNTLSHAETRHAEPSEKLLRELVHETLDLVFIKDSEGRYLVANPASALVAGRPVDEILGHTDEEVFPPEQAHQLREVDQRILASGQSETYDETFVVDGEIRHFSTAKTPARDDDGVPLGIIGISRDITDRKRTEEALARLARENQSLLEGARAEKRWLATILERTPMPLVFVEPGTARLFFANAAADRMAGGLPRPATVAEHQRCFDMRGVDGRPLTADEMPLVRAARGEELNGFQFCWTFPNGAARTLIAYSARLPAVHGHAETVMLAFDDITALKQTQRELQEAVRVRQDFLSVAGHELKTPLTAILLNVRVLDRALGASSTTPSPLQADPRLANRWQGLQRQIGRLTGLVERLLDVSRICEGKLTLDLEPLDLAEVASEVASRFSGAESPQITVDAPDPIPGRWDRLRVEQVITNLLSNAVTYGEERPVTITTRRVQDHAEIVVRDQGIGIAPEAVSRIFERFERAVSGRQYGGLGLGLWIVRQLVEAMDGSIAVESAVGRGSTFTVHLPIRVADGVAAADD